MASLNENWRNRAEIVLKARNCSRIGYDWLLKLYQEGQLLFQNTELYVKIQNATERANKCLKAADVFLKLKIEKKSTIGRQVSLQEVEKFADILNDELKCVLPQAEIINEYIGEINRFLVQCNKKLEEFDVTNEYNDKWTSILASLRETATSFQLDMPELLKLELALRKQARLKDESVEIEEIRQLLEISLTDDGSHSNRQKGVPNIKKTRKRQRNKPTKVYQDFSCAASNCYRSSIPCDVLTEWIVCDGGCYQWYHLSCLTGLKQLEVQKICKFVCEKCTRR